MYFKPAGQKCPSLSLRVAQHSSATMHRPNAYMSTPGLRQMFSPTPRRMARQALFYTKLDSTCVTQLCGGIQCLKPPLNSRELCTSCSGDMCLGENLNCRHNQRQLKNIPSLLLNLKKQYHASDRCSPAYFKPAGLLSRARLHSSSTMHRPNAYVSTK